LALAEPNILSLRSGANLKEMSRLLYVSHAREALPGTGQLGAIGSLANRRGRAKMAGGCLAHAHFPKILNFEDAKIAWEKRAPL
jgi:hypothetical protein